MVTPPVKDWDARTQAALEWERLWAALLGRIATEYGREAARHLTVLTKLGAVRYSMAVISEMSAGIAERGPLSFGDVHPIGPLLERAEKEGHLATHELAQVLATQQVVRGLAGTLKERSGDGLLADLAAEARAAQPMVARLTSALTPDGVLNEAAFPELAEMRREVTRRRDAIHRKLDDALRNRDLAPALQEKIYTLRGSRYVLPVKVDFRGQVPGIVHDVSASGATLFIEPHSVVEESNALTMAEKGIEARIAAILAELTALVAEAAPELRKNLGWLGRVDLIHGQGRLALDYQGHAPQVEAEGRIALKQVVNPLLLLDGEQAVRNDFALGGEARGMVISGANAGGKTVLLKAVGLCAWLVRFGMPIPAAAGSRCDLFGTVLADVGDQQSLSQSLSTFSAQLRFMVAALAARGPSALILIDEMLTGTAPQEGAALAVALLKALAAGGARFLVTTHYGELKELAAAEPGLVNASVAFDLEQLSPTYRLLVGTPGISYAFPIARRHGLGEAIVGDAEARLEGRAAAADALLMELHVKEKALREQGLGLEQRTAEAGRLRGALAERERMLAEREWNVRRRERGVVGADVEAARRRIAAVINELQGANSLPEAGRVRKRLGEVEAELLAAAPEPPPSMRQFDPTKARPGDHVLIRSLNRVAVLEELAPKGERARLRLGVMTLEVDVGELAPAPKGPRKRTGAVPRPRAPAQPAAAAPPLTPLGESETIGLVLPNDENTVDLRGMRLDAALERTEAFCDQCVAKHVSPVVVIHGHGTGRLKRGVREWMETSRYVGAFRPGEKGEGADGVTIAALHL